MEFIVNFSGGKDSSAMLVYLVKTYPGACIHVVFADTGFEHTGAAAWCQGLADQFGFKLQIVKNEKKTFLSMALARGKFPGMQQRQCTSDLKRDPIEKYIRNNTVAPVVINCMGHRSQESPARSKLKKLKLNKRLTNTRRVVYDWLPVFDWSTEQIFHFLDLHQVPVHPVYSWLKRFSCRVCIYMSDHELSQVNKNDPAAIDLIEGIEKQIGFTMMQRGPIRSLCQVD